MNDQAIRFRIGIFVLAALIVLAVLVTLFGGFPTYFKKTQSYIISFENAQGISAGTPVTRSGVRIGEARKVKLDNATGKVLVQIAVEEGFYLRRGDQATLIRNLLGGDSTIAFLPHTEEGKKFDAEPVPPDTELVGIDQPDPAMFLQKTADLVAPAQEAITDMRRLFKQFEKLGPLAGETLTEFRDLAKTMQGMQPELTKTGKEIHELITATRPLIEDVQKTSEEIRDLVKITKPLPIDLQKTSEEIREVARNAKTLPADLQKTSEEVRDLAKSAKQMPAELLKTNEEIRSLIKVGQDMVPELKKTNDEAQLSIRTWGRVGERVDVLIQTNEQRINRSLENLQESLKRTSDLLNDENLRNVRDTLRNVRNTSNRFDNIAKGTDDLLKDSRVMVQQLNQTLKRADDIMANISKLVGSFDGKTPPLIRNLEESSEKLNSTLSDVRDLIRVIGRSEGTVQKLLTDPTLFNNLNDASMMITRILPRLDRVMRDVEIFSDKIARHPESLGVGGAIRPGSGLKEPPTSYPRVLPNH